MPGITWWFLRATTTSTDGPLDTRASMAARWCRALNLDGESSTEETGLHWAFQEYGAPHLTSNYRGTTSSTTSPCRKGLSAAHLWRARFKVPFTARATAEAFFQWNDLTQQGDKELSTQIRFHLIYGLDSNLFVVFTDQHRNRGLGLVERDQAVQIKTTYRFYW